jgi:steroid 5-alpha reductase family enzyme
MEIFLTTLFGLFIYMNIAFLVSIIKKDNGTADIFYGGGFIVIAILSFILTDAKTVAFILTLLISIWGIRLMTRIFLRNRKKSEDYRYKKYREEWKGNFILRSYLQIYMAQGLVIYIVSLPTIFLANFALAPYNLILMTIGIVGWLIGFLFETIADLQLDKFIKKPKNKGKLLTQGLWKYSRHPNYFGESLIWWSVAVFALGAIYSYLDISSFLILLSPILITYTLLNYSGIPMLEKKSKEKEGWGEYKRKTSSFIPWFPKK